MLPGPTHLSLMLLNQYMLLLPLQPLLGLRYHIKVHVQAEQLLLVSLLVTRRQPHCVRPLKQCHSILSLSYLSDAQMRLNICSLQHHPRPPTCTMTCRQKDIQLCKPMCLQPTLLTAHSSSVHLRFGAAAWQHSVDAQGEAQGRNRTHWGCDDGERLL